MDIIRKFSKLEIQLFRFFCLNYLFIKSYTIFKKLNYDKYIKKKYILPLFLDFNKVEILGDYHILEKPINSSIKFLLIEQILFDLFDFYYEMNTNKQISSLVHHYLVIVGFLFVRFYGNTSHTIPVLVAMMTQFTSAYGFALRKILRNLKVNKKLFKKHERFMILMQIFIRIPMLYHIICYIKDILVYTTLKKKLHVFALLGYSTQFFNEFVWLIYP
tara:strand:+ start:107 stop:757 length:651 start_codon:yes stop_codon:yes gene_type:complete